MSDSDAIMRAMRDNSIKRLQTAEEAERRSMLAFQSGRFEDYWLKKGREAEERLEAEDDDDDAERAADSEAEHRGEAGRGRSYDVFSPHD